MCIAVINNLHLMHFYLKIPKATPLAGTDPGEVKWVNFHPPFSEPPSFFSYPSNIEIFDSSDIITKIHPPFQNPGSALATLATHNKSCLPGGVIM